MINLRSIPEVDETGNTNNSVSVYTPTPKSVIYDLKLKRPFKTTEIYAKLPIHSSPQKETPSESAIPSSQHIEEAPSFKTSLEPMTIEQAIEQAHFDPQAISNDSILKKLKLWSLVLIMCPKESSRS